MATTTFAQEAVDFRARLLDLSAHFCANVEIKDRKYRLKTYPQCFLGNEAVDFLVKSGFAKSRKGAVHLGRFMASEYQLFDHVCGDHELKDKHLFYRFENQEKKKTENGTYSLVKSTIDTSKDILMKTVRPEAKVADAAAAAGQPHQRSSLGNITRPTQRTSLGQPTQRTSLGQPTQRTSLGQPPHQRTSLGGNVVALDFESIGACGREFELKILEGLVLEKLAQNPFLSCACQQQPINDNTQVRSAILLEGESGSGKCALVGQLWKNVRAVTEEKLKTSILVGNGKFEQQFEQQPELGMPFYALTQALGEIVDQLFLNIYKKDNESTDGVSSAGERFKWRTKLREALGVSDASAKLFSSLVPRLGDLLLNNRHIGYLSSSDDDDDDNIDEDDDDTSDAEYHYNNMQQQLGLDGLKVAFRDLFRVLSNEFSVALCLDDMQFADRESILLLEFLLDDITLQKQPFVFIGTHHPLNSTSSAEFVRARGALKAERIRLENLTVDGVNDILHQLLKLDKEDTRQLAAIIHDKTQGSLFFVTQFLSVMEQRGLLTYSVEKLKWDFNLNEVNNRMDLADNVADLLAEKLRCLPDTQRHVLVLASALGSTEFDTEIMEALLLPYMHFKRREEGNNNVVDTDASEYCIQHLERDIGRLVKAGFVVRTPIPARYRFAHDKVRQAGLSFLPTLADQQKRLFLCLGKQLQKMVQSSKPSQLRTSLLLFQAVGLLNQAQDLVAQPNERKNLAKLNYKAGIMASARSAFFPASEFLATAVKLLSTLPDGGWGATYQLMLKIADLQITVEFRCGRLDASNVIADEVLGKTKSFEERKHAYFGKMLALMQSGESVEAKRLAINVLALLGVTFPKTITKSDIAGAKNLVLHLLQGKSDKDLMNLPEMKDPNALTIIQFLERLAELSFTAGKPDLMMGMLCLAWPLETTLRYGNSKLSCISFVQFSMLCMMMDMPEEGHRFGELALRYAKQNPGVPRYDCRCRKLYGYWIGHWRYPYQNFVVSLGAVLKQCWQKGVLENYFIDAHAYFDTYLCAGLSLGPLHTDIERVAGQMRDSQRLQALRNDAPLFQLVSNLVGTNDMDTSDAFSGEYFVADLEEEWILDGNILPLQRMYLFQMIHCYFFNRYKEAHAFMHKLWRDDSLGTAAFLIYQAFFRGMVSFAMAQRKQNQGKRQKLVRSGKNIIKKFVAWVEGGNVNAHHLLLLLKAEELTTGKASHAEVREAFDMAISAAARLGFMHSRAIGNERAGLFFLKEGDNEWAATYLQSACDSYEDWGALAKVDQIQVKHRRILRRSGRLSFNLALSALDMRTSFATARNRRMSQARLGVSRLDELSTDSHHSLGSGWSSHSIDSDVADSFGNMSLSFGDQVSGDLSS